MRQNKQPPLIPMHIAGMLCPHCEYDLRGCVTAICPECGTEFSVAAVAAFNAENHPRYLAFYRLTLLVPAWLVVYFVFPETFAGTLDRVSSHWIKFTLLNMPLQLGLAMFAGILLGSKKRQTRKLGAAFTIAALALAAAHVVISLATL